MTPRPPHALERLRWLSRPTLTGLALIAGVALAAPAQTQPDEPATAPTTTPQEPAIPNGPLTLPHRPPITTPGVSDPSRLPLRALTQRLQERLDAHREASGAPGASLALILSGGQELAICSGVSHRGDDDYPMTSGDRMPSGSVGKTYCAAIAMQLEQDGLLDLDAPVATYLGGFDWLDRLPNGRAITPRMLLNHTSGLSEHVTSPEFTAALRASPQKEWTAEELVAFALDKDPLFTAGEGWSYADTNFVVLGLVIETITQRPYNDLLRERLLEPLGLVWTDPTDRPDLWGLIPGYTDPANAFGFPEQTADDETYCINPQFEYTGGGTITTPLDLARWGNHLYSGRAVSPESVEAMTTGVESRLGQGVKYGLGTIIWPSPQGEVVGHAGWFPGYISMLCHYPDLGITVAYQQNTDVRASMGTIRRLLDASATLANATASMPPPQSPTTRPAPDPAPAPSGG